MSVWFCLRRYPIFMLSLLWASSFAAGDCGAGFANFPEIKVNANGGEYSIENSESKQSGMTNVKSFAGRNYALVPVRLSVDDLRKLGRCFSGSCLDPLKGGYQLENESNSGGGNGGVFVYKGRSSILVAMKEVNSKTALYIDSESKSPYPVAVRSIASALDVDTNTIIFASCDYRIGECGLYRLAISGSVVKLIDLPRNIVDIQVDGNFVHVLIAKISNESNLASKLFGWTGHVQGVFDWSLLNYDIENKCFRMRTLMSGVSGVMFFANRWNIISN